MLSVSQHICELKHPAQERRGDSLQTERAVNYFALFIRRTGIS